MVLCALFTYVCSLEPVSGAGSQIFVAYPQSGAQIDSRSTYITGAVAPGTQVTCNGEPVKVNAAGFFAHVVKLNRGLNNFNLSSGTSSTVISVKRPVPAPVVPSTLLKIKSNSLEPAEAVGLVAGDTIRFAARCCPGATMQVKVGPRTIPMYSAAQRAKGARVKTGLDTAFGVSYQRGESSAPDLYLGFYKLRSEDAFSSVKPVFTASKDGKSVSVTGNGGITVLRQPVLFHTRHTDTIIRVGPGQSRITPWVDGVRVASDGYKGAWRRLEVAPGKHLWALSEDLEFEPPGSPPAESKVSTVNVSSDVYGARVAIPLDQRLPYQVEQDLKEGTLTVKLFGATADTDFVTADTEDGQLRPADRASSQLIDYVTWKQRSDQLYELTVHLKKKHQWGFYVDYQDTTAVLHIKSPPQLDSAGTLKGVTICVDPGHGGNEPGASGCNGMREAVLNLQIAEKLKSELERLGARVIMTRSADTDVSLAQRVQVAIASKADFLISVHNNSLPDGRDPWKEHGTSSYWYHPQSVEAAKLLKDSLVREPALRDFGTRYQNLFLCRPSNLPAVLVEVGFVINPDEFAQLINPEFQHRVAASLADGLRSYMAGSVGN